MFDLLLIFIIQTLNTPTIVVSLTILTAAGGVFWKILLMNKAQHSTLIKEIKAVDQKVIDTENNLNLTNKELESQKRDYNDKYNNMNATIEEHIQNIDQWLEHQNKNIEDINSNVMSLTKLSSEMKGTINIILKQTK